MKKRISSLILLLALMISMFSLPGITASAAQAVSVKTDTFYEIYNVGGRKYLNVYNQTSYNDTNVTLWSRDYTPSEYFKFVSCNGAYMLVPKHAPLKAVNAYGDSPVNGSNCCLWDQTYHSSQLFIPEYVQSSNAFILRLKYNPNLCLTAAGGNDGSNVYFANYNGSSYQLWTSNALSASGSSSGSVSSPYNAAAAVSYAAAHWNDGQELCAGFVSNCLRAGGLNSWNRECTNLYNQLYGEAVAGGYATVQNLTASGNNIRVSDNSGKVSKGDVLFWLCTACQNDGGVYDSVGGPYQHVAIVSDVSSTYVKVYQHNSAVNNQPAYLGTCYECGRYGYYRFVAIHFNAGSPAKTPCSMSFSPSSVSVSPSESKTVSINFAGDGIYTLSRTITDTSICSASWGDVDYSKGTVSLKVTGNKPGSTQITVKLLDKNSNSLLSKSFAVTVSGYSAKISASPV